jgi:hypothetical protein
LPGVEYQEGVAVGQRIETCAGREIVGVLCASMQGYEQGYRRIGRIAWRDIEFIGA